MLAVKKEYNSFKQDIFRISRWKENNKTYHSKRDLRESGIDCACSLLGSSGCGLAQIRTSVPFTASRPLLWISCDVIRVLSLHSLTQLVTSIMSPYEDGARNSE